MKLKTIEVQNFRCFEKLEVDFHPALTVIVAENGMGKTTVLDAIAIGFGRLLTKLPAIKGIASKSSDLRIVDAIKQAPFLRYELNAIDFSSNPIAWSAMRKRDSSSKTLSEIQESLKLRVKVGLKEIDALANQLIDKQNDNEPYLMPVIVYYGTNRAISGEVKPNRGKSFSRFDALSGALESQARFRPAFEWFSAMEDVERRKQNERRDFDFKLPELDAVRGAIESMLEGFTKPRTEIGPLRFVIDRCHEDGITRTYQIAQLSDGYRLMLGLVMDLSRRMAQANPDYNNLRTDDEKRPLDFPAIVMIDEIDLHLHPKWQQKVIGDLQRTFPNTQFIVTTHSPQVLSSVPAETIRILEKGIVHAAPPGTEGAESSRLLTRVLGVDVRPPENKATLELNEYLSLVGKDQWNSPRAIELRCLLDARYQGEEPALLEADLLIENRKWELGQ